MTKEVKKKKRGFINWLMGGSKKAVDEKVADTSNEIDPESSANDTQPVDDITAQHAVSTGNEAPSSASPTEVKEVKEVKEAISSETKVEQSDASHESIDSTDSQAVHTDQEVNISETAPQPLEAHTDTKEAEKENKAAETPESEPAQETEPDTKRATQSSPGFFARLKQGLTRTRAQFSEGIASLFLGKKTIDEDLLEELETLLLMADVGIDATASIIDTLTEKVARKELSDPKALYQSLTEQLLEIAAPVEAPLTIESDTSPFVILMVGVNGVGKTTTIGKLAKKLQANGKSVMLAAGDTFRAAAVEQLQVWGERNNIPVVAQHTGADSASVIFDALQAAKSRHIDVLIADTAGRLHTKSNLMDELAKVKRVMKKLDPEAPHETMLVIDACTGQNAINQMEQFHQAIALDGLTITKLDGTAKGGIIFALAKKFGIPIRFIGVGESIDDLRPFDARQFIHALMSEQQGEQNSPDR